MAMREKLRIPGTLGMAVIDLTVVPTHHGVSAIFGPMTKTKIARALIRFEHKCVIDFVPIPHRRPSLKIFPRMRSKRDRPECILETLEEKEI
ncbi:hypothetical protein QJS10_CPA08g00655 [Acorus calamus]|uniref:Uncharacterized protein n=1 Tax=Acorus calamus TaxID=4465 RepID=A0AAV9EBF4_ACOCL|nr:hypothetical protein QJS10_CPA08g00655 [Acorus calamus]